MVSVLSFPCGMPWYLWWILLIVGPLIFALACMIFVGGLVVDLISLLIFFATGCGCCGKYNFYHETGDCCVWYPCVRGNQEYVTKNGKIVSSSNMFESVGRRGGPGTNMVMQQNYYNNMNTSTGFVGRI
jgi:hypothetical protein